MRFNIMVNEVYLWPQVIFPFNMDETHFCEACSALYHRNCIAERGQSCIKCERRRLREQRLAHQIELDDASAETWSVINGIFVTLKSQTLLWTDTNRVCFWCDTNWFINGDPPETARLSPKMFQMLYKAHVPVESETLKLTKTIMQT